MDSSGFPSIDISLAKKWTYPTNYPIRAYQVEICEQAIMKNTLVCIPTGLGKTLIASVVMYNYYNWFPHGKVVFMAPTKPLVAQQIKACHDITGMPESDTAHLEGTVGPEVRERLWMGKRIFFCTPQTLSNDIDQGRLDPKKIVCLVVDEAHRATNNYAYTSVVNSESFACVLLLFITTIQVRKLCERSCHFRLLGLSATPGTTKAAIQAVRTQ